MLDEETAKKVW